jgi:hypothetical protein
MEISPLDFGFKLESHGDTSDTVTTDVTSLSQNSEDEKANDRSLETGELSFAEDTSGGMGRHLGLMDTTFLM